jgi:glycine/sarcosine N-methyltransferase/sarcosine/dimethylglycine N-methyltransferase
MSAEDEFDRIASRYEKYVPWRPRLAREIPFLEKQLRAANAHRVLDCACGPGRHAVALAKEGFDVIGLDASPEMLERARNHARQEGVEIELVEGRFEVFPESLRDACDAVICLGNSLSAAENLETVGEVVRQFMLALRPGGIAITQTVDFSVVARDPVTATPVRRAREEDTEFLFVKSFLRVEEQVLIHWVSLENRDGKWESDVSLRAVTSLEPAFLLETFQRTGYSPVESFGDYTSAPFEPGVSRDLILVARRPEG